MPQKSTSPTTSIGFTLVEVLVALAILLLLAAITYPIASAAKKQAMASTARSNLQQIGKALRIYSADFDERLPMACSPDVKFSVCRGEDQSELPLLHLVMSPYVKSAEIWMNPLDRGIPRVSADQYTEPIQCQLPGTAPTMYAKYGTSFIFRQDLAGVRADFALVAGEGAEEMKLDSSQAVVIHDACGAWQGGTEPASKVVNALYSDGHVKLAPHVEVRGQLAFEPK